MYIHGEMDEDENEDCNVHTDFSDFYSSDGEFDRHDNHENVAGM